ncbi:hypothetical protein [Haloferula sp. BvORR071]|uniref:hypothetical protein n=1 Tax=Haloferula sp. BvORR071 TaxID=1396141 RepID=UPI002240FD1F|nr:hypothetical protein [Haloferula sp. BvORR071]
MMKHRDSLGTDFHFEARSYAPAEERRFDPTLLAMMVLTAMLIAIVWLVVRSGPVELRGQSGPVEQQGGVKGLDPGPGDPRMDPAEVMGHDPRGRR